MLINKRTLAAIAIGLFCGASPVAADTPGKGTFVQPIKGSPANVWFQHLIVQIGLEKLGYEFGETLVADFPALHLAIASGDAHYTFSHWKPLHDSFFDKAGGTSTMTRTHAAITGAGQGYYIDKRTAEAHDITNLDQMKNREIAALFDSDGDGRANLAGCNPGWGCELSIENHLEEYDLRDAIQHDQGSYFAIMADAITRYNEGGSILYYTWTPNWISDVLVPGTDVVQIGVPSAGEFDPGFAVNDVFILANNEFLEENPAAAAFFKQVNIPISAVNAAQIKLRDGENTVEDFRRHAEDWVAANQATFDGWVTEAAAAAN